MPQVVDCRGLPCPQPVIKTKAVMAAGADEIVAVVDNDTAVANVTNMARKAGWNVTQEHREDGIHLYLTRPAGAGPAPAPQPAAAATPPAGATVVFVRSDRMGVGDDELGLVLIRGFFHTLLEFDVPPAAILFVNSGVKLTVEGSPVLDDLKELERRGAEVLSCGTCLNFFKLTEKLAVGKVTNMYAIVEMLLGAGRLVSP